MEELSADPNNEALQAKACNAYGVTLIYHGRLEEAKMGQAIVAGRIEDWHYIRACHIQSGIAAPTPVNVFDEIVEQGGSQAQGNVVSRGPSRESSPDRGQLAMKDHLHEESSSLPNERDFPLFARTSSLMSFEQPSTSSLLSQPREPVVSSILATQASAQPLPSVPAVRSLASAENMIFNADLEVLREVLPGLNKQEVATLFVDSGGWDKRKLLALCNQIKFLKERRADLSTSSLGGESTAFNQEMEIEAIQQGIKLKKILEDGWLPKGTKVDHEVTNFLLNCLGVIDCQETPAFEPALNVIRPIVESELSTKERKETWLNFVSNLVIRALNE
ncbi:hypothetical protein CLOP_g9946 [Closterium sp. NIES-67]|nr:hypothetical protein CLOP_g9946 [Closterium sp. NIES-67]